MNDAPAREFLKTHSLSGRASSRIVLRLIESMKAGGWHGPPIVAIGLSGEKYVLDGHHRLVAARHAKILVRYRLANFDELTRFGYSNVDQVVTAHAEVGFSRLRLR